MTKAAGLTAGTLSLNTCAVKPPGEAFKLLADKGEDSAKCSSAYIFIQSFYAGCYIGFGALLAATIAGSIPGMTEDNPGFKSFVFAALFPVNLLLILLTGGLLFTGMSASSPAAIYEGRISVVQAARCLALSWIGNVIGSSCFAYFVKACALLEGPTKEILIDILRKKVSKDFFTTFLKGIGCNWMVCMAVFLCGQAQDMTGKYVGIWFPISTFVMIGFEHIPANFFLLASGLLADGHDVTFTDVLLKNWIPVTCGNFFAGAFIVAGGYSFMFGSLGVWALKKMQPKPEQKEQGKAQDINDIDINADLEGNSNSNGFGSSMMRCVSEGSLNGV